MATLTIRKLDPAVKEWLRVRAAQRPRDGRGGLILSERCGPVSPTESLADIALLLFGDENGGRPRAAGTSGVARAVELGVMLLFDSTGPPRSPF